MSFGMSQLPVNCQSQSHPPINIQFSMAHPTCAPRRLIEWGQHRPARDPYLTVEFRCMCGGGCWKPSNAAAVAAALQSENVIFNSVGKVLKEFKGTLGGSCPPTESVISIGWEITQSYDGFIPMADRALCRSRRKQNTFGMVNYPASFN